MVILASTMKLLSEPASRFPRHLAKAFADLFEPRLQDHEDIWGLLRLPVQVPNFVVRLRLIFVRLAQARLLPIRIHLETSPENNPYARAGPPSAAPW